MCWRPEYIILIVMSTLVDYYAGIQMGKTTIKSKRKPYLILSLILNLGLLFSFKYFNFFNNFFMGFFEHYNILYKIPELNILLPVGISFYTFQTLSYTIDVYRGVKTPEKHLGIFALYVAFFPQLVAGPIERSFRLLPQFHVKMNFDYKRITSGLTLMLWGFFQKIVIADRLALVVDRVYGSPTLYQGIPLIIATYFFAFQIYCDFSGYTDIARGAAQIMGYDLMANFKRPYFAKSIRDFWNRWHISLTSWFKDYLYVSLGGNRVVKSRWYCNVLIVFLLSGLWHGANWTFIVWGALHGIYFIFAGLTKNLREKMSNFFFKGNIKNWQKIFKVLVSFHLVCFAWIFFRAKSLPDAFYVVGHLFKNISGVENGLIESIYKTGLYLNEFVFAVGVIVPLLFVHILERQEDLRTILSRKPIVIRWAIYLFMTLAIMNFGVVSNVPFIYFQF